MRCSSRLAVLTPTLKTWTAGRVIDMTRLRLALLRLWCGHAWERRSFGLRCACCGKEVTVPVELG